jgi:lipid-A-disaccharide synthase
MAQKPLRLFFSAGEPSGDIHGANLIRELKVQYGPIEAVGYGGPKMEAAGCCLHVDLTALAVMWFLRALANLHKFWDLVSRADRYFRHQRPDAVVLIDYPGFNWWIARRAKVHGIPVFYYAPPQIWAWARWRVKKMRRLVDHVLCSLPFEQAFFAQHGCNAVFVGHPFFDEVRRYQLDVGSLRDLEQQPGPLVALLPGSRTQEVKANLREFLEAAALIRERVPDTRFAVAAFKPHQAEMAQRQVAHARIPIQVHVGKTPELIHSADCCVSVSGSVSLELLHRLKPTVIRYRISRGAYFVQRLFRKSRYITLVNLLTTEEPFSKDVRPFDQGHEDAHNALFPEYLSSGNEALAIAEHISQWLSDAGQRESRIAELARLKSRVAHGGAARRASEYILQAITDRRVSVPQPHFAPAASLVPQD